MKWFEFDFRRLLVIHGEKDQGYDYRQTLVVYMCRPDRYESRVKSCQCDPIMKVAHHIEEVVTHWRHRVIIDLWLVTLRFEWQTKTWPKQSE